VPEQKTSISELVGWAWDDTRKQVPDLIVFTEAQDLVEEAEACFIVKTDSAGHRHCLQQVQSPRNCYALRKLQKAPHCRVQAAGTEACLKSRSA
jgi:hypothetical protein